jgi:hypothetical protein
VASGTRTERPGLNEAVAYGREGDTLVMWKLDRFGRSLAHLIEGVRQLQARGVGFRSLHENIDTTGHVKAFVPVLVGDRVVGTIDVESEELNAFQPNSAALPGRVRAPARGVLGRGH